MDIMKRLATVIVLSFILAACGKDEPPVSSIPQATPEPQVAQTPEDELSSTEPQESAATQPQAMEEVETPEPVVQVEQDNTAPPTAPEKTEQEPQTESAAASTGDSTTDHTTAGGMSEKEGLKLAQKSGCLACHRIEKKLVGPAWQDVATRYADKPGSRAMLIEKVKKGGKGNWTEVTGGTLMPPYGQRVSEENTERLVDFILALNQ